MRSFQLTRRGLICVLLFCNASHGGDSPGVRLHDQRVEDGKRIRPYVVVGITGPQSQSLLGVTRSGRVDAVLVDDGAFVHEGDVLIQLQGEADRAQLAIAAARAETTLDIELARTRMDHARRELQRLLDLNDGDFTSPKELSDARLRADLTRIEYEVESFKHAQAVREHERQKALVARLTVRAPFDGYVTELFKHPGESINESETAAKIVQLNPLEVVVDCPLSLVGLIRLGDEALVVRVDDRSVRRAGEVVMVPRVVEPASQTARVKLRVWNSDARWMAGVKVEVDFGEALAARGTPNVGESPASSKAQLVAMPGPPTNDKP